MFEAQVAYYLNRYLGKYLYGLDAESLRVSVWKGDVELRGLTLRPEALQELDLPITVKAGLLGRLTLKVPWARLGREPVVVEFDRLYILAGPKEETNLATSKTTRSTDDEQALQEYIEAADAAELALKRDKAAAAEGQWLQELEARQQQRQQQQGQHGAGGGAGGRGGAAGWMQAGGRWSIQNLMDSILGNLQLVLTNVHVRYEDDQAWPGHTIALGLLLQRMAAHTVDEEGRPAFLSGSLTQLLRKALTLCRLGIYFDVDRPLSTPPEGVPTYIHMNAQQWDDLFMPVNHMGHDSDSGVPVQGRAPGEESRRQIGVPIGEGRRGEPQGGQHQQHQLHIQVQHDFLVQPISGVCRYTRRSAKLRQQVLASGGDPVPAQDWVLGLEQVAVCLSASQYAGIQSLAESLDAITSAAPHRHLRPHCRPHQGAPARMWWVYAIRATTKRISKGQVSWAALQRAALLRRSYIPTYARALALQLGGTSDPTLTAAAGAEGQAVDGSVLVPPATRERVSAAGTAVAEDGQIKAMDAQLEQGTIVLFRRLAHARALTLQRIAAAVAQANQGKHKGRGGPEGDGQPHQTTGRTWGQWLGWSGGQRRGGAAGTGPGPPGSTSGGYQGEGEGAAAAVELSGEEWARLEELLAEQETALEEGSSSLKETPYTLRVTASLSVDSLALLLVIGQTSALKPPAGGGQSRSASAVAAAGKQGSSGVTVVAAAELQRLGVQLSKYPSTVSASLQVGSAGVSTPHGQLLSTGSLGSLAAVSSSVSPAREVSKSQSRSSGSSSVSESSEQAALALDFIHAPQDDRADVVVDLRMAPSFITYVPAAVEAVQRFFVLHRDLELAALTVRAQSQAEALRRGAALQLAAIAKAQSRPRLELSLCAHAPKIALPSATGTSLLLLDLGQLTLTSNRQLASSLPPQEAALFECLAARLDSVAAYTADYSGAVVPAASTTAQAAPVRFEWPSMPELDGSEGGAESIGGAGQQWDLRKLFEQQRERQQEGGYWRLHPLLDRFALNAQLQLAMAVHPRYPKVRAHLDASCLAFHFSPGRYQAIMQVLAAPPAAPPAASTTAPGAAVPSTATGGPPSSRPAGASSYKTGPRSKGPGSIGSVEDGAAAVRGVAGRGGHLPEWAADPEHRCKVRVLQWEGGATTGGKRARWHTRWATIWRGRLYLTHDEEDGSPLTVKTFWQSTWRLVQVPADLVAEAEHCVGILPSTAGAAAAAAAGTEATMGGLASAVEAPDALVLRCASQAEAVELRKALQQSRATMAAIGGLLGNEALLEGASVAGEGEAAAGPDGADAGGPAQGTLLSDLMRHSEWLELHAVLPELALHLSGRPPTHVGPDTLVTGMGATEVSTMPFICGDVIGAGSGGTGGTDASKDTTPQLGDLMAKEKPLIVVRLCSAVLSVAMNQDRTRVGAAMRALQVEDLLLGRIDKRLAYMACSGDHPGKGPALSPVQGDSPPPLQPRDSTTSTTSRGSRGSRKRSSRGGKESSDGAAAEGEDPGDEDDDEDVFYDAMPAWATSSSMFQRSSSSVSTLLDPISAAAAAAVAAVPETGSAGASMETTAERQEQQQLASCSSEPLVSLVYISWPQSSPKYTGVDSELTAKLSSLHLRLHRPTVAALMIFGSDISAVGAVLAHEAAKRAPVPPTIQALQGDAGGVDARGRPVKGDSDYSDTEDAGSVSAAEVSSVTASSAIPAQGGGACNAAGGPDPKQDQDRTGAEESATEGAGDKGAQQEGLQGATQPGQTAAEGAQPKKRTVMRLVVEMRKLALLLPYETVDECQSGTGTTDIEGAARAQSLTALGSASVENVSFTLDVFPDSLALDAALGNLVALYEALPETSPHRTICTLRPGGPPGGSLVKLHVMAHPHRDMATNSRVPSDGCSVMYSVKAELSAIQLIYLQCFFTSLTEYIFVMLAMCPPPLLSHRQQLHLQQHAAGAAQHASELAQPKAVDAPAPTPLGGPMALLLDIDAKAPVILLPRNSESTACLELDLGSLALSNALVWRPAVPSPGCMPARVLMDNMKISLKDLSIVVAPDGSRGTNLVHSLGDGLHVTVRRPLAVTHLPGSKGRRARRAALAAALAEAAAKKTQGSTSAAVSGAPQAPSAAGAGTAVLPLPPLPEMRVRAEVPDLALVLSDTEYSATIAVMTANFTEQRPLPPDLKDLHSAVLQASLIRQQAAALAAEDDDQEQDEEEKAEQGQGGVSQQQVSGPSSQKQSQQPQQGSGGTTSAPGAAGGSQLRSQVTQQGSQQGPGLSKTWTPPYSPARDWSLYTGGQMLRALGERSFMSFSLLLRRASLKLCVVQQGVAGPSGVAVVQPLAQLTITDMWLSYTMGVSYSMAATVCLPTLSIHDLRPGVAPDQALVLSSTDAAKSTTGSLLCAPSPSLFMLEYRYAAPLAAASAAAATGSVTGSAALEPRPACTGLRVRLQQPTLVLDLAFLLRLAGFVAPGSQVLSGAVPRPYTSREILLGKEPYQATADLWLSPEVRLLADCPGVNHFVYDGCGHRLILPPDIPPTESLPLILIGPGCTLELHNVSIINSGSLAAVLQVGPDARLLARPDNGVLMLEKPLDEMGADLEVSARFPSTTGGVPSSHPLHEPSSRQSSGALPSHPPSQHPQLQHPHRHHHSPALQSLPEAGESTGAGDDAVAEPGAGAQQGVGAPSPTLTLPKVATHAHQRSSGGGASGWPGSPSSGYATPQHAFSGPSATSSFGGANVGSNSRALHRHSSGILTTTSAAAAVAATLYSPPVFEFRIDALGASIHVLDSDGAAGDDATGAGSLGSMGGAAASKGGAVPAGSTRGAATPGKARQGGGRTPYAAMSPSASFVMQPEQEPGNEGNNAGEDGGKLSAMGRADSTSSGVNRRPGGIAQLRLPGSTSELQDVLNTSPGNAAYIPSRLGQQTGPASLPSPASTTGLRAYGRATLGQGQGGGARVARVSRRLALLMDITATYRSQGACQWSEAALKGLSIRSITLIAMQQPSLSPHTQYPSQTMQHQYSQHGSLIPASTLPDPAVDDTAAGDLLPVAVNRQYSATSASTLAGAVSPGAGPAAWQYTAANSSSSVSCSTVLEPCDIGVQFRCLGPAPTAASGAQGQIVSGQPPRMDIALDISDLLLRMSPDVLQLVLTIQSQVMAPLLVPAADKPLLRTQTFTRIWASHGPGSSGAATDAGKPATSPGAAAGGTPGGGTAAPDPMAAYRGCSLWRPACPPGYASLGDVAVSGAGLEPGGPVAVVAISSGLVAWPVGFTCVWEDMEGIALWRPIPPPGYVALGCAASGGPWEEPPATAVACVAEGAVVPAHIRECALLCAAGNLWVVANAASTLLVAPPDSHLPPSGSMLDLRNPLGVPPAALASDADLLQQYQQQVQAAAAAASTISTSALHGRSHGAAGGPFSPRGPSQPTTPATAAHAAVNALLGPSHNPLNPSHEAQELSHPISTGNESEAVTSHPLRQVSSSTTGELQGGSTQPAASTAQAGAGTTNTQSRLRQVSSGGAAGAGAERSSGALATSARGTRATSGGSAHGFLSEGHHGTSRLGPAVGGEIPPVTFLAQHKFLRGRSSLVSALSQTRSSATCVEFRRIWWDKHMSSSPSEMGVSFWRPVAPPGFASLGDCMVNGVYAPPQGVLVLRDTELEELKPQGRLPLLAKPIGYAQVWLDEHQSRAGSTSFLSLWRPVPPPGYVAMGYVAEKGPLPPPVGLVRCVRSDAVSSCTLPLDSPQWVQPPHRHRIGVAGWTVDDRLSTFLALAQDDPMLRSPGAPALLPAASQQQQYQSPFQPSVQAPTPQWQGPASSGLQPGARKRLEGWRLKLQEEADQTSASPAQGPVGATGADQNMHISFEVRAGRVAALLRSATRVPLLEVGAADIKLGLGTQVPGVIRGFLFATASAWSYQPLLAAWEPVLEPWQLLVHVDRNALGHHAVGVAPGLHVKVTSTQGCVTTTFSHAAAAVLLSAAQEWSAALSAGPTSPGDVTADARAAALLRLAHLSQAEGGTIPSQVVNSLGSPVDMLLDHGTHQELVSLGPGQQASLLLPLPLPTPGPLTTGAASAAGATGSGRQQGSSSKSGKAGESGAHGGSEGGASQRAGGPQLRLVVDVVGLRASAPAAAAKQQQGRQQQQGALQAEGLAERATSLQDAAQAVMKQGTQAVPLEDVGDVLVYMQVGGRVLPLMSQQPWGLATRALPLTAVAGNSPDPYAAPDHLGDPAAGVTGAVQVASHTTTTAHPGATSPAPVVDTDDLLGPEISMDTTAVNQAPSPAAQPVTAAPPQQAGLASDPEGPSTPRRAQRQRSQGPVWLVKYNERFMVTLPPSLAEDLLAQGAHGSQFAGKPMDLDFHLLAPMPPTQAAAGSSSDGPAGISSAAQTSTQEGILAEVTLGVDFDWLANQTSLMALTAAAAASHVPPPTSSPKAPGRPQQQQQNQTPQQASAASGALELSVPLRLGVPVKVASTGQLSTVDLVVRLSLDTNQVDWAGAEGTGGDATSTGSTTTSAAPGRATKPGTIRRGLGGARGLGLTSPGSRALRLPPSDNWVPFTLSGLQLSSAAAQGGGVGGFVAPIPLPDPKASVTSGVALESTPAVEGGRREVLRSLCQISNATTLNLEVSFVAGSEEAAWTLVPASAASTASASASSSFTQQGQQGPPRILEVVEEEVFEHERFVPLRGWSSSNLMPGERQRFVAGRTGSGPAVASSMAAPGPQQQESATFPQLSLPPPPAPGLIWDWDGPWEVEGGGHVDKDGWAYGSTWTALAYPFGQECGIRRTTDFVRRRRWVRRRILRQQAGSSRPPLPSRPTSAFNNAAAASTPSSRGASTGRGGSGGSDEAGRRVVLGVLEPGERMSLPLGWSGEGCDVQVRPLVSDPRATLATATVAGSTVGDTTSLLGDEEQPGTPTATNDAQQQLSVEQGAGGPPEQHHPHQPQIHQLQPSIQSHLQSAWRQGSFFTPSPLLLTPDGDPLHKWSTGGGGGSTASVPLSDLKDGGTRMLMCDADRTAAAVVLSSTGSASELPGVDAEAAAAADEALQAAVQPHWMSVTSDCDPLIVSQGALDTLLDWRLTVRPPLTIHNTLPVPATFAVWERGVGGASAAEPGGNSYQRSLQQAATHAATAAGKMGHIFASGRYAGVPTAGAPMGPSPGSGPLRCRFQGRIGPGQSCPVYTADLRQQVFLSFWPDGCEFGETEPVMLSEGVTARSLAGVAASPRLPDSFRCSYSHSTGNAPLRLALTREIDLGAAGSTGEGGALGSSTLTPAASYSLGPNVPRPAGSGASGGSPGAPGGRTLPMAEALAQGCPLTVRVHVPLVVLNSTQLPISVGVLTIQPPPEQQQGGGERDVWGGGEGGGGGRGGDGLSRGGGGLGGLDTGSIYPARILDTDAFTSVARPPTAVSIPPRSLELLSLPPRSALDIMGSPGGGGGGSAPVPALVMSVLGSKWTPPLPLPTPPSAAAGGLGSSGGTEGGSEAGPPGLASATRSSLTSSGLDPVLIRARGRTDGEVYEVVARFEPLTAATTAVLGSSSSGDNSGSDPATSAAGGPGTLGSAFGASAAAAAVVAAGGAGSSVGSALAAMGLGAAAASEGGSNRPGAGTSDSAGSGLTGVASGLLGAGMQPWVLRLETHLVVSNRTGFDLVLAQPESVVLGGSSSAAGASEAGHAAPTSPARPLGAGASAGQGGPARSAPGTPTPLTRVAHVTVPAGAVGVPIVWNPAAIKRALALAWPRTLPAPGAAAAQQIQQQQQQQATSGAAGGSSGSAGAPQQQQTAPAAPAPAPATESCVPMPPESLQLMLSQQVRLESLPLGGEVQLLLPLARVQEVSVPQGGDKARAEREAFLTAVRVAEARLKAAAVAGFGKKGSGHVSLGGAGVQSGTTAGAPQKGSTSSGASNTTAATNRLPSTLLGHLHLVRMVRHESAPPHAPWLGPATAGVGINAGRSDSGSETAMTMLQHHAEIAMRRGSSGHGQQSVQGQYSHLAPAPAGGYAGGTTPGSPRQHPYINQLQQRQPQGGQQPPPSQPQPPQQQHPHGPDHHHQHHYQQQQQQQQQQQGQPVTYICIAVSACLTSRAPGCLALTLAALGAEPGHLLHNVTPHAVAFREAVSRCAWQVLPPFSALGYIRQAFTPATTAPTSGGRHQRTASGSVLGGSAGALPGGGSSAAGLGGLELLVRDASQDASPVTELVTFDSSASDGVMPDARGQQPQAGRGGGQAQAPTASSSAFLRLGADKSPCMLQVGDALDLLMSVSPGLSSVAISYGGRTAGTTPTSASTASTSAGASPAAGTAAGTTGSTAVGSGCTFTARAERVLRVLPRPWDQLWGGGVGSSTPSTPVAGHHHRGNSGGGSGSLPAVPSGGRHGAAGALTSSCPSLVLVQDAEAATGAVAAGMHFMFEVSGLEISLVDSRPQELVLVTLDGLSVEWHAGATGGVSYTQLLLKLRNIQVDDQLPGSPHPVVLLPMDANRVAGRNTDPLVFLSIVAQPNRMRGAVYYPCIAARILPLRVAVGEGLVWRLFSFANLLSNRLADVMAASSANSGAAAGSGGSAAGLQRSGSATRAGQVAGGRAGGGGGATQQITSETPLGLNLLNVEDLQLRLSFKADPAARPRFANQLLSLSLDLAALDDLPLELPGLELERVRVRRGALLERVMSRLQQRLWSIAMAVLRNYGVLGSTSKVLAIASQGISSLAEGSQGGGASAMIMGSSSRAGGSSGASGREVGNVGEGVLEGGKALAKGVLAGAVGVLARPLEGAERGGLTGFLGGVAKGIVGVAANPLGGALAAASKVTEGIDATYGRVRETVFSAPRRSGRKRLPRSFTGDRVLRPFSLHPALGQALLYNASFPAASSSMLTSGLINRRLLSRLTGGGSSSTSSGGSGGVGVFAADSYEDHFVLPKDKVLLVTNRRVMLLSAPDFVGLQLRVMSGEVTHVTSVPGGTVLWALSWEAMLTAELAWFQQIPGVPADGVLVHRKRRSGSDDALVYDVRCRPNTSQAQEVLSAVLAARSAYHLQPQLEAAGLKEQALLPAMRVDGQERPDTVLSFEFRPVWFHPGSSGTLRSGSGSLGSIGAPRGPISIWRPIGPPGYAMLGDVAVLGVEPPPRPVRMYCRIPRTEGGDSPAEGPRLAPPTGYSLLFRSSAPRPITIWRPIPPRGYTEVGYVAWPDIEEPPLTLVACLRRDLVAPARLFDYPVWSGVSSDNQYWRAFLWQVDSAAMTFVGAKMEARPQIAYAPIY